MSYIYDEDLKFLGDIFIQHKDLEPLFNHLWGRVSHEFDDYECYKKYGGTKKHKLYWKAIAGELQKFGGNTIANKLRGNGVKYKEIACDVAKKIKVKVNENEKIEEIENKILAKLLEYHFEKMEEEEKNKFIEEFNKEFKQLSKKEKEKIFKNNKNLKSLLASQINTKNAFKLFRVIFKAGGFKSYQITVIVVNSVSKAVAKKGLTVAANAALTKNLALLVGPIGAIISGILTVYNITGPAYRVTIPGVVMVAMLRKECEQRKIEEERRLAEEKKRIERLKRLKLFWVYNIISIIKRN